jgi:hypothetical protein
MGEILYAGAIHIREQSKVDAARITKKSGNERRGAQSELQRFSASLGNRRIMDAAGKNINAITENIGKNLDAGTFGTFMGRVAAAEELGANAAAAAAAGAGGSSVEAYNATLRLSYAMQEEQQGRAINSDNIAASNSRGTTMTEAAASMDNNVYRADLDFSQYVDHKKMGLFQQASSLAMAAAATYFGGPQAGMAVISLAESRQQARNGDLGGAQQSMIGAIQGGISAFKDTRSMAGPNGGYWDSVKSTPKPPPSIRLK